MSFEVNLMGQVAVVTGATGGIGAKVACYLAKAGAQVVVCDVLEDQEAQEVISDASAVGLPPIYIRADLTETGSGTRIIQQVLEQFHRVDIMVNNAVLSSTDWSKAMSVNVISPLELIEAAAEDMKIRGYGKIVNVTSCSTFNGGTKTPQYVATKGALDSLTRFLAKRYAPSGILVNALAPGPVLTKIMQKRYTKEEFTGHYIAQMPIARCLVEEDIAGGILFLCSELCSCICGETILCDGGRVKLGVK